jgi:hypothetical protein
MIRQLAAISQKKFPQASAIVLCTLSSTPISTFLKICCSKVQTRKRRKDENLAFVNI